MHREREDGKNFVAVAWFITEVRHRLRLSQESMAAQLGMECVRYYQDLEYGEKQPSLAVFLRILALSEEVMCRDLRQRLCWPVPVSVVALWLNPFSLAA